jgi:hypothetical protein
VTRNPALFADLRLSLTALRVAGKNGSNFGVVSFFGLFVEDSALLGATARRTHISVALKTKDRHGPVLDRLY